MPRISLARSRTSSIERASLTPPPLPRPPAWICALTTQTGPPSDCAALTASSTVNAGTPRGVVMPKRRKISLPWYSWIFTTSPCVRVGVGIGVDVGRSAIPPGVVAAHRLGGVLERMAAVELERLVLVMLDLAPQPGEGLQRGSRQEGDQLGQVAAAAHAAERVEELLAEAVHQVAADELRVPVGDPVAGARIRHPVGAGDELADGERQVDGHPRPHVVHRFAGRAGAGQQHVVVVLGVDEPRLDVDEPVLALPAFVDDRAHVQALAGYGGRWQRHGVRSAARRADGAAGSSLVATIGARTLILCCRAALPQPRAGG